MSNSPMVSVIIPTYNRAELVGRAIQSVLAQTFDDWELIVVDDASTDNTEKVVSSFTDTRIRYHQHNTNRGGSDARNTGIRNSKGQFIAFLDSDDKWLEDKLYQQVMTMKEAPSKVGLVYTGMVHVRKNKARRKVKPIHEGDITKELIVKNSVGSCSCVLVRKKVFERVGYFDTNMPSRQDIDMWFRISKHYDIVYIEKCSSIIFKEKNRSRISTNKDARCRGYLRFYNKHKDVISKSNKYSKYMNKLGLMIGSCTSKKKSERVCYKKSISSSPFAAKAYLLLLLSFLPSRLKSLIGKLTNKIGSGW